MECRWSTGYVPGGTTGKGEILCAFTGQVRRDSLKAIRVKRGGGGCIHPAKIVYSY